MALVPWEPAIAAAQRFTGSPLGRLLSWYAKAPSGNPKTDLWAKALGHKYTDAAYGVRTNRRGAPKSLPYPGRDLNPFRAMKRVAYRRKPKYAKRRRIIRIPRIGVRLKNFDTSLDNTYVSPSVNWVTTYLSFDQYQNTSNAPATYNYACLVPTAVGSGNGQVNGDKFHLRDLRWKGEITKGLQVGTALAEPTVIRLALVLDKQCNAAQENGAQIFDQWNNKSSAFAFRNMQRAGRFRIIKDYKIKLDQTSLSIDPTSTTLENQSQKRIVKGAWHPKYPIPFEIKGTSSTPDVAQLTTNNLFWVCHTQGVQVTIRMACRCYYYDT